jgi:hypothetical protein
MTSENTMSDLRREVASRLRETLHGREIDTMEKGMPEIEHMLGVVTIGAISTDKAENGTILDPDHDFWNSYHKDVDTKNAVEENIWTAMKSLFEDDVFRVTTPYGEDAGILYVEVDEISEDKNTQAMVTTCAECGASIQTEPELKMDYGQYRMVFDLDCRECEFNETVRKNFYYQ